MYACIHTVFYIAAIEIPKSMYTTGGASLRSGEKIAHQVTGMGRQTNLGRLS